MAQDRRRPALRLSTMRRSATRINSANIAGNTTIPYAEQSINYFTSVAPARSSSRRASSRTTSRTAPRSIRRSSSSSRRPARASRCRRSRTRRYEAGVKYELLQRQPVAQCGALFQITKYNARSQNTDGTFSATGTVRVKGVRDRCRRPHHARMAGVRRLRLPRRAASSTASARGTHGQCAAQHAQGLGQPLDDLHLQGNL